MCNAVVCVVGNRDEIGKREERNIIGEKKIGNIERFQKSVMFSCMIDRVWIDVYLV